MHRMYMGVLNQSEFENFTTWVESLLIGAQLQKVWTDGVVLVLECHAQKNYWLCFDLNSLVPYVALLNTKPGIKKIPKPVSLFLSSHADNLRFTKIFTDATRGRVFQARLESGKRHCEFEAWIIPKNVNFFVRASHEGEREKKISWSKPRELPEPKNLARSEIEAKIQNYDWFAESTTWLSSKVNPKKIESQTPFANRASNELQRSIGKKEKAIEQISSQLQSDLISRYRNLGELLKYSTQVPSEYQDLYDSKKSLAENRERAFKKAKDLARKQEGARQRIEILKIEIHNLKQKLASGLLEDSRDVNSFSQPKFVANKILKNSVSKARKRIFDGNFEAVMGKSAQDNLSILRSARGWDYWLHLKDYPGAHAIVFRNKAQGVPDSVFIQVAQWVVDETISKKQISSGLKYDVILAECRYVKPVKGAPGLVTFQNSRTFTFASK
jgi:hypothetical protein